MRLYVWRYVAGEEIFAMARNNSTYETIPSVIIHSISRTRVESLVLLYFPGNRLC